MSQAKKENKKKIVLPSAHGAGQAAVNLDTKK